MEQVETKHNNAFSPDNNKIEVGSEDWNNNIFTGDNSLGTRFPERAVQ